MEKQPTMEELIEKVNKLKATGELDLSIYEDFNISIINLINLFRKDFFFNLSCLVQQIKVFVFSCFLGSEEEVLLKTNEIHDGDAQILLH